MIKKMRFFSLWLLSIMFFAVGCTPSTFSKRYSSTEESNKPAEVVSNDDTNNPADDTEILPEDQGNRDANNISKNKMLISDIIKKNRSKANSKKSTTRVNDQERFTMEIIRFLNTDYKYGGNDLDGIDCSAFTKNVYGNSFQLNLPRTAAEQYQVGERVSRDELQFGDLVFFHTRKRVRVSHVGIYLGDRMFVHASSSNGVMVSSLDDNYYQSRYIGASRVSEKLGQ